MKRVAVILIGVELHHAFLRKIAQTNVICGGAVAACHRKIVVLLRRPLACKLFNGVERAVEIGLSVAHFKVSSCLHIAQIGL